MNLSFNMKCFLALLSVTIFFYSAIGNGYTLLVFCLIIIFFQLLKIFNNPINQSFPWIIFIMFVVFSFFYTKDYDASLKFVFVLVCGFIIKEVLKYQKSWQSYFAKFVYFFAMINVFATILSVIVPDLIIDIVKRLYDAESYAIYMSLYEMEAYAGINVQTGTNAFFISVFIAFIVTKIIDGSGSFSNYVFLSLSVVALILTQKRSFLFANACAAIVVFLCNNRLQKNKIKKLTTFLFLAVVVLLIFRYLPFTQNLLDKWNLLVDEGDVSNGRFELWKESINVWKTSPLFGVGAGSLVKTYDLSSHNVYIQVLTEMGIFGAISYLALTIYIMSNSFKLYNKMYRSTSLQTKDKNILGISMYIQVIYVVYSFFGNPLYDLGFYLTFVVFVAVLEAYNNSNNYKNSMENDYENRDIDVS